MSISDSTRLLLEVEKIRRDVNRDIVNEGIPELHVEDIRPIEEMIATARRDYLHELFELAKLAPALPTHEQIQSLSRKRQCHDELREAIDVLETVIDRGYLDVAHD